MTENLSMIGARFISKYPMLGANAGDVGFVFNQYQDFDDPNGIGVQVIFPNGNYDGFSVEEQAMYLVHDGYDLKYADYQFKNVLQVGHDYRNGYWSWS